MLEAGTLQPSVLYSYKLSFQSTPGSFCQNFSIIIEIHDYITGKRVGVDGSPFFYPSLNV